MSKKRVSLKIDGVMVLVGVGVVGGLWLYGKRELINKVNPAHPDNVVNQGNNKFQESAGLDDIGGRGYGYYDHLFGAVDLVNPWNESDDYAEKVWGLEGDE